MICIGRVILRGTLDSGNPLSVLRGNALVLSKILDEVTHAFIEEHVDRQTPNRAWKTIKLLTFFDQIDGFPEPTGVNINMMPIELFDLRHNKSIPDNLKCYIPLMERCRVPFYDVHGKIINVGDVYETHHPIGYLTVSEEYVKINTTQRRPGLHIERPSALRFGGELIRHGHPLFGGLAWGMGCMGDGIPIDGIFMASSVANTCRIYNEIITKPEEVADGYGGIEQMRAHLGPGRDLEANELVWLTDCTPHEALPMPASKNTEFEGLVYRQFFRLVVGRISVWYSQHSTVNPTGTQPDAIISHDCKYI